IQIFVKTTTEKMIHVEVESSDMIANVKAKIQDLEWFLLHKQCLVLANKKLDDLHTIADYNIKEKSILRLVSLSE
ncbi:ubiquitin, partial [Trifolium medium]|nr:ubiquitin [Trifolium medium]